MPFASAKQNPKVLMVVSSYGEDQGKTKPGYEFDEFAKAYLVFKQNGLAIDVASPKGGLVEADEYDASKPFNAKLLADEQANQQIAQTIALSEINAQDYQAVFVVGGKGAMFDLPYDKHLQAIIADIYQNQGTVSAVCHGPAALTEVKLANGEYLVANKKVNGFTNEEEKVFGKKWVKHFDFLLEDRLIERGAKFEKAGKMLGYVAIDNRLVTGQNPMSTGKTAIEVVRSLGITPKAMHFADEASMELVNNLLVNNQDISKALAENTSLYDPKLIAMYGFFHLKTAADKHAIAQAVKLMEASKPYMKHPKLSLAIAKGYEKLGNYQQAKLTLNELLATNPEFEDAKTLLNKISSNS